MMSNSKKILIVEDEPIIAEVLSDNLEAEGYDVTCVNDGEKGLDAWRELEPELVLLDVMIPRIDGCEVCRIRREEGAQTPVLFLSAKGEPEDRVKGLSAGGDDYLTKPFHLPELLLRVNNMMLRQAWQIPPSENTMYSFGGHQVDLRSWEVILASGRRIALHEDEFRLLHFFIENPDRIVDREELIESVWGDGILPSTRELEQRIHKLRAYFEEHPDSPRFFKSLPGFRFCFTHADNTNTKVH